MLPRKVSTNEWSTNRTVPRYMLVVATVVARTIKRKITLAQLLQPQPLYPIEHPIRVELGRWWIRGVRKRARVLHARALFAAPLVAHALCGRKLLAHLAHAVLLRALERAALAAALEL